jgi:hypothetical protein
MWILNWAAKAISKLKAKTRPTDLGQSTGAKALPSKVSG